MGGSHRTSQGDNIQFIYLQIARAKSDPGTSLVCGALKLRECVCSCVSFVSFVGSGSFFRAPSPPKRQIGCLRLRQRWSVGLLLLGCAPERTRVVSSESCEIPSSYNRRLGYACNCARATGPCSLHFIETTHMLPGPGTMGVKRREKEI